MQKRAKFLKHKSILQIFILISAIFTISLLQPVEAQQKACCERTNTGDSCVYTDVENCKQNYNAVLATCDKTQYCQPVCCIDKVQGSCYKNVGYASCISQVNTTYDNDATCNSPPECDLGCCVLGTECIYTTSQQCSYEIQKYTDMTKDFRLVDSEQDCLNLCKATESGCCVSDEGTCTITTRDQCSSNDFHANTICSDPSLPCSCTSHHHKGCLPDKEDVYWFDSCNNPEDIAEDCDYIESSTSCAFVDEDYTCKNLDCLTTWDNPLTNYDGVPRKNGESWCEYDGTVGMGGDLVGSRHYRHICINGEEIVEPCKDYREEYCIQATVTGTPKGDYTEAFCAPNRWVDCVTTCNKADSKSSNYESQMRQDKECCESTNRDCAWMGDENGGKCIPLVPPGFKFWSGESSKNTPKSGDGSYYCSKGDTECTVVWYKEKAWSSWECVANCNCLEDSWIKDTNSYCRSLGDCGAHYNIVGKFTTDGYYNSRSSINEGIVGGFGNFKNTGTAPLTIGDIESDKIGGFAASYQVSGPLLAAGTAAVAIAFKLSFYSVNWATVAGSMPSLGVTSGHALGSVGLSSSTTLSGGIMNFLKSSQVLLHPIQSLTTSLAGALAFIGWVMIIYSLIQILGTFFGGNQTKEETYYVTCSPWQAPATGADCNKCSEPYKTCSEYRCKSLGQPCEIINEGTDQEKCIDQNPNDVTSPMIEPWPELHPNYQILSTPNGYKITQPIKPFEKLTFGVKTNELAKCKYSETATNSFDDMPNTYFNSFYSEKHNLTLTHPEPGKSYSFYIRCTDTHGNKNTQQYKIEFTIQNAPDLTSPRIALTSISDQAYLPYNTNQTPLAIYVDDYNNVSCKWSTIANVQYKDMPNNFTCLETRNVFYDNMLQCIAILTGMKDNQDNVYFFRCQDILGNTNMQDYIFTLKGSKPLTISSTGPKDTIYYNDVTLYATTSGGSDNGVATCYFKSGSSYIKFFNTDANIHSQSLLDLQKDTYSYDIKCEDSAGNIATSKIQFTVAEDTESPTILYIYKTGSNLYIILNEASNCQYSTSEFKYGSGILMTGKDSTTHTAPIQDKYFIICKDLYGNEIQEFKVYT